MSTTISEFDDTLTDGAVVGPERNNYSGTLRIDNAVEEAKQEVLGQ